MIDVLLVEDSPTTAAHLGFLLGEATGFRLIGVASSAEQALRMLATSNPQVVLMDIHLPGIDGVEATRHIMSTRPLPVVLCTASTNAADLRLVMRCMEAGALAVVKKPRGFGEDDGDAAKLIETLRLMSEVRLVRRWSSTLLAPDLSSGVAPPAALAAPAVVAMGASTGGPPVLQQILAELPRDFPLPILVVQHLAPGFVAALAQWLAAEAQRPVEVAQPGVTPRPGHVYLAADDGHLEVGPRGQLVLTSGAPVNGARPAVDVLFRSVGDRFGANVIAVLLTGMGRDGAGELKRLADLGALTIAQDEKSSAVFGMPGAAVALGAARNVLAPAAIAQLLAQRACRPEAGAGNSARVGEV